MSAVVDVRIRRILVALDLSEDSLAALEASAELAQALGAELMGLYVEDQSVLHLTRLPFAREVDALSGHARPLESRALEGQLRSAGTRARNALEAAASRRSVAWSFRTVRGKVSAEIRRAAREAEADLVVLGVCSRLPGRAPGSTTRAVAESPVRVLVLRRRLGLGGAVRVGWDGGRAAREALELASLLARATGSRLVVIDLSAPEVDGPAGALGELLERSAVPARVIRPSRGGAAGLLGTLARTGGGLVVLPRTLLPRGGMELRFLGRPSGPVLLVG